MRIQVFGAWDPDYARNRVLRLGLAQLGQRVDACRVPPWRFSIQRYTALLWESWKKSRPDVMLVPEFRHRDVPLARLLASCRGIPLVVDPLVSRFDTKVNDWRAAASGSWAASHAARVDRAAMRFADLLLCDTPQHAAYFQERYRVPPERCCIVPVGFDDGVFQRLPPPPTAPFRVAFFGSYLPLHGVEVIIEAARMLRASGIRFLMVGQGGHYAKALHARRQGLPLDLVPYLPPLQLRKRLRNVHVVLGVFGQSSKALRVVPNKVYQGLALGRSVVTADTPAVRSLFEPERHLVTVPPGDAAALGQAILRLRDDAPFRNELARRGAAWTHARYSPRQVAGAFLAGCAAVCDLPAGATWPLPQHA